jgi:hypothetical protein
MALGLLIAIVVFTTIFMLTYGGHGGHDRHRESAPRPRLEGPSP